MIPSGVILVGLLGVSIAFALIACLVLIRERLRYATARRRLETDVIEMSVEIQRRVEDRQSGGAGTSPRGGTRPHHARRA